MNKLYLALVLVSALAVAAAHKGKCNIFNAMKNFDEGKYIGDWYVLSASASPEKKELADAVCMKCSLTLDSPIPANDGTNSSVSRCRGLTTIKKKDGTELQFEIVGQSVKPRYGLKQMTYRKKNDEKWEGIGISSVIATDYENWAISYFCKPYYDDKTDSFETIQKVQILGRKPELDANLHGLLKQVVGGFELAEKELINADTSGC